MADPRRVLRALAGEATVIRTLPTDSPLARHLPAAQRAIEAFCAGDDSTMRAALKRIPFRSPYRDLRWLLEALVAYPADKETGLERLARISADSPLRGPATVAKALLTGADPRRPRAARDFVAAFRAHAGRDAGALFQALMAQADSDPRLVAACKALLVHHPEGMAAYEQRFGSLDPIERRRLRALHEERHGDPLQAYDLWTEVGEAYEEKGDVLRAAAVARHRAEMVRRFGGATDAEVGKNLVQATRLDPDDRDTWLALAEYGRLAEDPKQRRQAVEAALQRFPDDPRVIAAAAHAAFDRGAYRKAARFYARLLRHDPLDREARQGLIQSRMAQARRQLQRGRAALARKELEEALALADDDHSRTRVFALRGMVERRAGDPAAAEACFDRARALLPPPLGDWTVAAAALALDPADPAVRPLVKLLRQVMAHAALQGPDKATVLALLRAAVRLHDADGAAVQTLLKAGTPYFRKALTLDWDLAEIHRLGELLLRLERWQWLRDLVRHHPRWSQQEPLLVYWDAEAKCRGVPENLGPYDLRRLFAAQDAAAEAGQSWLAQRIDTLIRARAALGPPVDSRAAAGDEWVHAVLDWAGGLFGRSAP